MKPTFSNLLLFGATSSLSLVMNAQKTQRPNILIILADDLGHGDLSCMGGKTPTPNIDKIFAEGTQLDNFMTCPVSSPTRAGLLTGLHPIRTGQGPETDGTLDPNITNIGNFFQKEGYKTGLFGKWHNSPSPYKEPGATLINKYGFDRYVGFYAGGIDYFTKGSTGWFHDGKMVVDELDYSTDLISKYAIEFMDKSKNASSPFMCYVPFNAVHTPLNVKEDVLQRVPASIREKVLKLRSMVEYQKAADAKTPPLLPYNAKIYNDDSWNEKIAEALTPEEIAMLYSAVLISLDDNVGKIMDYLKTTHQLENTIVLYFADNGGTPEAGNNFPFSGFKHSVNEGGVHSAAAMIIPKTVLPAPVKTVPALCGYLDMFPTLAALTNAKQALPRGLDGISIVDNLKGTASKRTDRYYYWVWRNHDVLRSDKWKMFRYWNKVTLYDLENDIAELKDVAAENPDVVAQMKGQIDIEAKKLGAAYSHLPLNIKPSSPNPQASAIAVALDIRTEADMKKQNLLLFSKGFDVLPESYMEFDIKVDAQGEAAYCYLSPFKDNRPIFDGGIGIGMDGKLLSAPVKMDKNWKHVAVGLCGFAPRKLGQFGLSYKFNTIGRATIYIDNIVIKNMKGQVTQEIFVDKFNKNGFKASNASIVEL